MRLVKELSFPKTLVLQTRGEKGGVRWWSKTVEGLQCVWQRLTHYSHCPSSPWIGGPRYPVIWSLRCLLPPSPSPQCCVVLVANYLLFFVPLSWQCGECKGSHFTHDTNGGSKRPYDAVIEFHQIHIQNHALKKHYLGCKIRKCQKKVFLRAFLGVHA